MALKARILRARVTLADTDRQHYDELSLTIAQHPSETTERMMLRLLIYCFHADEQLAFTRGLSTPEEPELWRHSDDGRIEEWIELGQPPAERLKKASGLAQRVYLYTYGRGLSVWWRQQGEALTTLPRLSLYTVDDAELAQLAELADKNMNLTVTIAESVAYVTDARGRDLSVTRHPLNATTP